MIWLAYIARVAAPAVIALYSADLIVKLYRAVAYGLRWGF